MCHVRSVSEGRRRRALTAVDGLRGEITDDGNGGGEDDNSRLCLARQLSTARGLEQRACKQGVRPTSPVLALVRAPACGPRGM